VEEGDITLQDLVVFELLGEVAEGSRPAGKEDDPARLPVEAVDWLNPEPGITVDLVLEVRVSHDTGLKDGTKIPSPPLLHAQAGGLLDHKPALARRKDRNGKRVRCHHQMEMQGHIIITVTQAGSLTSH
jgi:hypothetical protein